MAIIKGRKLGDILVGTLWSDLILGRGGDKILYADAKASVTEGERSQQAIGLELGVDHQDRSCQVNGSAAVDIRYRRAPFSDDSFG